MTEEAKQARLAYRREWQRKNRDKVKAYNERYWEKKASGKITSTRNEMKRLKGRAPLANGGM